MCHNSASTGSVKLMMKLLTYFIDSPIEKLRHFLAMFLSNKLKILVTRKSLFTSKIWYDSVYKKSNAHIKTDSLISFHLIKASQFAKLMFFNKFLSLIRLPIFLWLWSSAVKIHMINNNKKNLKWERLFLLSFLVQNGSPYLRKNCAHLHCVSARDIQRQELYWKHPLRDQHNWIGRKGEKDKERGRKGKSIG